MKKFCRHLVFIGIILVPTLVSGQESLFPSSYKDPGYTHNIYDYIVEYSDYSKENLFKGSLEGLEASIKVIQELNLFNDPIVCGSIENQFGILEYYRNNLSDAISHYLKALEYYEELSGNFGINTIMNNIAIIFSEIEDHESTRKYLKKALTYTEEEDINSWSIYMLNLAETESNLRNCRLGIRIAKEVLDKYDPNTMDFSEISIHGILLNCNINLKEYEEARTWIDRGLESITEETTFYDQLAFYKEVVEFYFINNDYQKVLDHGKKIYPPPDESFLLDMYETINCMAISARITGDLDLAVMLDSKANDIEYDHTNLDKGTMIEPLMVDYMDNREKSEQALAFKQLEENSIRNRIQRRFLINLGIVMLLLVVSIIILARTRKLRKKYQLTLKEKNDKLESITRQLTLNNSELEKENGLLDTLISVFAHDLINPFQAILGFSQLMLNDHESLEDEEFIEYTGLLSDTSFQLNQLLINLKGLAIVNDNSRKLEASSFSLKPLIENILKLFGTHVKKKNIVFKAEACDGLLIYMNKDILESVLRNVVSNAVKFSKPDSSIELICGVRNNNIEISVKDSGIGMPKAVKSKLLKREYVESLPGTLNEKGSGIGLGICMDMLQLFDGSLHIDSKEGSGTIITIRIPVRDE